MSTKAAEMYNFHLQNGKLKTMLFVPARDEAQYPLQATLDITHARPAKGDSKVVHVKGGHDTKQKHQVMPLMSAMKSDTFLVRRGTRKKLPPTRTRKQRSPRKDKRNWETRSRYPIVWEVFLILSSQTLS